MKVDSPCLPSHFPQWKESDDQAYPVPDHEGKIFAQGADGQLSHRALGVDQPADNPRNGSTDRTDDERYGTLALPQHSARHWDDGGVDHSVRMKEGGSRMSVSLHEHRRKK